MKPTAGMDEKSGQLTVVMQQPQTAQESASPKRSNKRLLIGIVSGITLALIIVAAILLAVFLGAKVTKDAQKEAWLNYQDENGKKKSEHVVANDREEDYTVPNELRIIYDFEKGYAVHKVERSDDDEETVDYNVCYVSHLDRKHIASPQEVKDSMTDNEIEVPSKTESEEQKYESTGQEFDRNLLSPRAQEMCKNSKVVWMAKTTGETRDKRGCYIIRRCTYYLVTYGGRRYIARICRYYRVCT